MDQNLLTLEQAAAYLGVALVTMRRYSAENLVPVTRFSSRVIRVRKADLDAMIARGGPYARPTAQAANTEEA
jgi:excisionase family DNA binding protein